MVERETIELDAASLQMLVVGGVAKRGLNGEWAVVIKLDGEVSLGPFAAMSTSKQSARMDAGRILPAIGARVAGLERKRNNRPGAH